VTSADETTEGAAPAADPPQGIEVDYRRAPRFGPFVASGVVLGVIVGLVVASFGTVPKGYSLSTVLGFFGTVFALVGGLLGGAAAVLVDRRR
jgi:hypothetical protein